MRGRRSRSRTGVLSSGMKIRTATADDARAIADVQVASWRAAYRDILPATMLANLSVDEREPIWRKVSAIDTSILLVAESESGIVGFACANPARDNDVDRETVGEISAIYLLETAWGTGVGRALYDAAWDRLRSRGFTRLIVWVLEENHQARSFYERMGMRRDIAPTQKFIVDGGMSFPVIRYHSDR